MVKRFLKLVFSLGLLVHSVWVYSQTTPLDTIDLESVSIYVSRSNLGIRTGIKSFTVDSLIMREKAGLSLSELLQENSPIFIKTYGRGATATASFRGTGASHTNVYWNGIKINSPMSGEADFSLIPLHFVDDVMIHFGQSSMKFGSGGFGGSVNMQSAPKWTDQHSVNIFQSLGSFETYSTAIKASYGKGNSRVQTRVFREISQNNFPYRNTAKIGRPIEIQENADYHKYGVLQEFYHRPSHRSLVAAKIWFQETNRGIPRLMSNFSSEDKNRQNDQALNAIVSWKQSGVYSWYVSSSISYFNLNYVYSKISTEGNVLPIVDVLSKSWNWSTRTNLQKNLFSWLSADLQAEINSYWVDSHENILMTGYTKNQRHAVIRTTLNAVPSERIFISLFFGEDIYEAKPTPLSSSLSIEYRLLKSKNLSAKGGISRNYHHPSLNDLYWQPGGNRSLKPEDGVTIEGGLKYETNSQRSNNTIDLTFFSSQISNWIMWLPHLKGYWEPINLNRVKAQGFEISLSSNPKFGQTTFKIMGTYGYTRSTIENADGILRPEMFGKQLPFIPVHSGGIAINALWKDFLFAYTFTHYSERYTTTSNNPNSTRRLYPYYMSSASFGKDFKLSQARMGLQFRIDNLLNESYQTILWRPMPGRNYNLVIRLEL